jgi:hypothetical protein
MMSITFSNRDSVSKSRQLAVTAAMARHGGERSTVSGERSKATHPTPEEEKKNYQHKQSEDEAISNPTTNTTTDANTTAPGVPHS